MKVSFDFDGSLSRESLQKYAKKLVDDGHEVHIVTARYNSIEKYDEEFISKYKVEDLQKQIDYLFEVADSCGIPRDRIHFQNMLPKAIFFQNNDGFLWHLDDDDVELNEINSYTDTIAISCVGQSNWISKCNKLIKKNNEVE